MPNLIDPNSTIEFGKLKLKNPFNMTNPDSNDYLCAFDTTDGELSKTNISAKQIANLKLTIHRISFFKRDNYSICVEIINNNNTMFTRNTLLSYVQAGDVQCSGWVMYNSTACPAQFISAYNGINEIYIYYGRGGASERVTIINQTLTDNMRLII